MGQQQQQQRQQQPAGQHSPQLTVASLLRQYTPSFVARHRRQAPPPVQSTLAKLSLCRTAAPGGRRYRCDACDSQCQVHNSCGDRHCPQCSGARRADWLTSTSKLLLPGIDYFQVVFTLPNTLPSLALGNRREIYNLLFRSAWQALREIIAEEQGFEASAVMVLHTWNQQLQPHAHVHAIVPGGGPSLDPRRQWVRSQRRSGRHQADDLYLVDTDSLRERFREVFLKGLRRLHHQEKLKLDAEFRHLRNASEFESWLKPLEKVKWAINIQPPPSQHAVPEHVLKYLARYLDECRDLLSPDNVPADDVQNSDAFSNPPALLAECRCPKC
ncbi:MAG: transposase zinc-binding domain-containing protein, partial [Acidimicrobiales bacterium]